jgi:hypothetical protein
LGKRGLHEWGSIQYGYERDVRLLNSHRIGRLLTFTAAINITSLLSKISVYTITIKIKEKIPF